MDPHDGRVARRRGASLLDRLTSRGCWHKVCFVSSMILRQTITISTLRYCCETGEAVQTVIASVEYATGACDDPGLFHIGSDAALAGFVAALDPADRTRLPLWGTPFGVKDNIDVAGMPTTAACPAFAYTPGRHATAVQRLVDAGAIPVGKTNLDQFATGLNGTRMAQPDGAGSGAGGVALLGTAAPDAVLPVTRAIIQGATGFPLPTRSAPCIGSRPCTVRPRRFGRRSTFQPCRTHRSSRLWPRWPPTRSAPTLGSAPTPISSTCSALPLWPFHAPTAQTGRPAGVAFVGPGGSDAALAALGLRMKGARS